MWSHYLNNKGRHEIEFLSVGRHTTKTNTKETFSFQAVLFFWSIMMHNIQNNLWRSAIMTFLTVGLDFTDILYNNYYYLDIESIPYQTVFGYVIHVIVSQTSVKDVPILFSYGDIWTSLIMSSLSETTITTKTKLIHFVWMKPLCREKKKTKQSLSEIIFSGFQKILAFSSLCCVLFLCVCIFLLFFKCLFII